MLVILSVFVNSKYITLYTIYGTTKPSHMPIIAKHQSMYALPTNGGKLTPNSGRVYDKSFIKTNICYFTQQNDGCYQNQCIFMRRDSVWATIDAIFQTISSCTLDLAQTPSTNSRDNLARTIYLYIIHIYISVHVYIYISIIITGGSISPLRRKRGRL